MSFGEFFFFPNNKILVTLGKIVHACNIYNIMVFATMLSDKKYYCSDRS